MASLSTNDRVSLCLFSYEDGRRCRTPRTGNHPHFCFYHAQKEARAQAAEKISKDLAYFFAGDYLSANDLSTALARLIPAVLRGDIKPRTARTVAFMLQTLSQTIRLAQHEYVNTFGSTNWNRAIAEGVAANSNYRHTAAPASQSPEPAHASADSHPSQSAARSKPPQPTPPVQSRFTPPSTAATRPQPPRTSRPSSPGVDAALSAACASTPNPFRVNTYTAARKSMPPKHLRMT
jgi:hypothetical protein